MTTWINTLDLRNYFVDEKKENNEERIFRLRSMLMMIKLNLKTLKEVPRSYEFYVDDLIYHIDELLDGDVKELNYYNLNYILNELYDLGNLSIDEKSRGPKLIDIRTYY